MTTHGIHARPPTALRSLQLARVPRDGREVGTHERVKPSRSTSTVEQGEHVLRGGRVWVSLPPLLWASWLCLVGRKP